MRHVNKQQRPASAQNQGDGMKLHLREVEVGRRSYRLITLRPGTAAAFSTNYFHDTWHIITDLGGARLLGRLLWGLSYQQRPGTVVAIHGEHLRPTPFDADPSDPILVIPAHLTRFDRDDLRRLKDRLPHLQAPTCTVRWQTHGLDNALADPDRFREENGLYCSWFSGHAASLEWKRERMDRCGGWVSYTAPPRVLRQQSVNLQRMRYWDHVSADGTDYHYLAEGSRGPYADGEVQIFQHYQWMLSVAAVARREVLESHTRPLPPEPLRQAVYQQCESGRCRGRKRRRAPADSTV